MTAPVWMALPPEAHSSALSAGPNPSALLTDLPMVLADVTFHASQLLSTALQFAPALIQPALTLAIASTPADAETSEPAETSAVSGSGRGAGGIGFAGVTEKLAVASAAGLATLSQSDPGVEGVRLPLLPGSWEPDDAQRPPDDHG